MNALLCFTQTNVPKREYENYKRLDSLMAARDKLFSNPIRDIVYTTTLQIDNKDYIISEWNLYSFFSYATLDSVNNENVYKALDIYLSYWKKGAIS